MKKIISASMLAILLFSLMSIAIVFAMPNGRGRLMHINWSNYPNRYEHGLAVDVGDGMDWYFKGPGSDAPSIDIPGHVWQQTGPNRLKGLHFNVGPGGAASWWSSDGGDGELLYVVYAIISPWTYEIANKMASQGYIHYHELVNASWAGEDFPANHHPSLVVWLKHIAVKSFTLDGGPHAGEGDHPVTKGLDNLFIPIYFNPSPPTT